MDLNQGNLFQKKRFLAVPAYLQEALEQQKRDPSPILFNFEFSAVPVTLKSPIPRN